MRPAFLLIGSQTEVGKDLQRTPEPRIESLRIRVVGTGADHRRTIDMKQGRASAKTALVWSTTDFRHYGYQIWCFA